MGIGGNCLGDPEELNGFYRESGKINGLSVYNKRSGTNWICPFCSNPLKKEQVDEIVKIQDMYVPKIESLAREYAYIIRTVVSEEDIDIFPKLEKLDDEINKYIEDFKAFQYYKFKCEQCKKELYLNLGQYYDARYEFLRYRSNIWRTDESERDELINLRKENLRKKTDNKYLQEWNELCVRKEAQILERAKKLCAQEANRVRNTYGKIAIGFLSFILDPGLKLLKYRVNILNLIKYVSNFATDISDGVAFISYSSKREMTDEELKEFRKFQEMREK